MSTPEQSALMSGAQSTNAAYNRMFGGSSGIFQSPYGQTLQSTQPTQSQTSDKRAAKTQRKIEKFGTNPYYASKVGPDVQQTAKDLQAMPGMLRPIDAQRYLYASAYQAQNPQITDETGAQDTGSTPQLGIDYGLGGGYDSTYDMNMNLGAVSGVSFDPMTGQMIGGGYGSAINDGLQFAQQSLSTGSENILGRDVNNINDLYALRSDLFKAQSMAQGGDDATIQKLVSEISGIPEDYMSPELGQAIRNNGANMFTGTLNYVDGLIAKEMDLVGSQASVSGGPFGNDYANLDPVRTAAMGVLSYLPSSRQEQVANTVNTFIAQGQTDAAKEFLRNVQLNEVLDATTKKEYRDLENISNNLAALNELGSIMQQQGIDTGKILNSKESFLRWAGTQSDPLVTQYAQQAQNALDLLTRARTGAALTEAEEAFYQRMFPSLKNKDNVNQALSNGLQSMLQSQLDGILGLTFDSFTQQSLGIGGQQQDPYIQELLQMGYTPEQLQQAGIMSFSQGSSISSLDELKAKIAGVESGGNYKALGPVISNPKSQYYGQQAMGKYQVMPGNLTGYTGKPGGWDMMVFGQPITPAQFMNNPQLQEQMASAILGMYVQQYGNYQDAISAWHSGKPLKQALASGARDVNMTTGQYVNNVLNYA